MTRDLIVLVADLDIKVALQSIFDRPQAMGVLGLFDYDIQRDAMHDPSVLRNCHETLRSYSREFAYALVVCDREGCGVSTDRASAEADAEQRLRDSGWINNSAACVVIEPEIESWVWSNSPHVEQALGWHGRAPSLREWLVSQGYLSNAEQVKPSRPKEAMKAALRLVQKPRSAAIYGELGSKVSLTRCTDPSFLKLVSTLRQWFPATSSD